MAFSKGLSTIRSCRTGTHPYRTCCAILAACHLIALLAYLFSASPAGAGALRVSLPDSGSASSREWPAKLQQEDDRMIHQLSELTIVMMTADLSKSRGCVKRLLASIPRRVSRAARLIVAHEGPRGDGDMTELLSVYGGRVHTLQLAVDAGRSVGRNALVRAVTTPYFLFVDDDFVVAKEGTAFTLALMKAVAFVRSGDFHIVGGSSSTAACAYQYKRSGNARSTLSISPAHCDEKSSAERPMPADAVGSFFLGSTAHAKRVLWDPALKIGEHEDFFLRAQDQLKVGFWSGLEVGGDQKCRVSSPEDEEALLSSTSRVLSFWKRTFNKHALTGMHTPTAKYKMRCQPVPGSNLALEPLYASSIEPCVMDYTDLKSPFPWGNYALPVPDPFPQLAEPGSLEHGPVPCRVAVATMATGRYIEFVSDFWTSAGQFLLPQCAKHLFLFTDRKDAAIGSWGNVTFVGQEKLGWPFDSIMRFEMYLSLQEALANKYDYFYAIDSDALFVAPIGQEILGRRVAALSAWYHGRSVLTQPLDSNPASPFYIPSELKRHYFAGGLFGGEVGEVMSMLGRICPQVRALLSQPVPYLPPWHDESILNHEFNVVAPPDVILGPEYLFPEPPASNWLPMQQRAYYYGRQPHFLGTRAPKLYNLGVRKATDVTLRDSPFVPITGSTVPKLAAVKPQSCSAVQHLDGELDKCVHWIPDSFDLTQARVECASRAMHVCTSYEAQRMAADGVGLCQASVVSGPQGEECTFIHINQWCDTADPVSKLQCSPGRRGQALCCASIGPY